MTDTALGRTPTATQHSGAPSMTAAARRTMLLAAALVVVSALALSVGDLLVESPPETLLTWWSVALIAIAAEFMVFDVEFRREVYSFTFSEVPLVLGLFLAHPRDLLLGRLLGEVVFLVLRERQPPRKVLLNTASFAAEVTVLLAVARLVGADLVVTDPTEWLRALIAVAAAIVVGYLTVFQVVRWHGAPIALSSILAIGALTIPVNTSFALVIGVLLVDHPWATTLLLGVAGFLVLAYRSYTNLRQRFDSLSLLYDFTRLVSGAQRPDAVLEAMLAQAKDLLRAERAEIWLHDDGPHGPTLLRLRVDHDGRHRDHLGADAPDAMRGWFAGHGDATIVRDAAPAGNAGGILHRLGAADAIIAPITESGEVVGLVAVVNRLGEVNHFLESDRTMFATLANHASVALENGRLIDRLHQEARLREHEAVHDALTGLPNRVRFADVLRDRLTDVAEGGRSIAVALMDLDGFKEVNDTLGHHTGDAVLVEVARRVSYAAASAAVVARLGGDEFALVIDQHVDRASLDAIARHIRAELAHPVAVDGMRIDVSASIGFALAPDDASDAPTLLQRADVAMYSAKAGHGNGVAFYESIRDENSPRRLALANDLRSAITAGQLSVVYQPKARLADGDVSGFEALVRWHHPVHGTVLPDEFIPVAERTGTIDELTRWVLERATTDAVTWHARGRRWSVAVNVAMRDLLQDDFAEIVAATLRHTGCPADLLTLEITETTVMSDTSRTIEVLHRLGALGVRLSVDDFGTGYSSLSYLQQLPVVELKIDKFFVQDMVRDPGAEAIVRSVLDLASNLGLEAVAEGVEDEATWQHLRRLGCAYAQGFHLARPMADRDVLPWSDRYPGNRGHAVPDTTDGSNTVVHAGVTTQTGA